MSSGILAWKNIYHFCLWFLTRTSTPIRIVTRWTSWNKFEVDSKQRRRGVDAILGWEKWKKLVLFWLFFCLWFSLNYHTSRIFSLFSDYSYFFFKFSLCIRICSKNAKKTTVVFWLHLILFRFITNLEKKTSSNCVESTHKIVCTLQNLWTANQRKYNSFCVVFVLSSNCSFNLYQFGSVAPLAPLSSTFHNKWLLW